MPCGGHLRFSSGGCQHVTISLELRFEDDSLSGRASDETGAAKDFTGWLGLVSAIDSLLHALPPAELSDPERESS
jgi:hypothetical protein